MMRTITIQWDGREDEPRYRDMLNCLMDIGYTIHNAQVHRLWPRFWKKRFSVEVKPPVHFLELLLHACENAEDYEACAEIKKRIDNEYPV